MIKKVLIQEVTDSGIGIAKRKGIGYPDTIYDEITEQISIELCEQEQRKR